MIDPGPVLLLLIGLQIKHFLGDFVLQTPYMLSNRRHYGHPGGLMHTGVHVALSAVVLLLAGTALPLLAGLLLLEGAVHYHMDWAKDNFTLSRGLTPQLPLYWMAVGADQLIHQLTYVAMVWIWAVQTAL